MDENEYGAFDAYWDLLNGVEVDVARLKKGEYIEAVERLEDFKAKATVDQLERYGFLAEEPKRQIIRAQKNSPCEFALLKRNDVYLD